MGRTLDELREVAVAHGYSGDEPKTIAGAIDALADTLAGEDIDSGRTIAEAVRALAPYVGGGAPSIGFPMTIVVRGGKPTWLGVYLTEEAALDGGFPVAVASARKSSDGLPNLAETTYGGPGFVIASGLYAMFDIEEVASVDKLSFALIDGTPVEPVSVKMNNGWAKVVVQPNPKMPLIITVAS